MSEPLPVRALLVDDDPVVLALLSAFLSDRGYAVDHAPDGEAALARLAGADYNLVITDRHMPRMDGLALCRAMRERPQPAYVYCIMLTGASDERSLVAAMEAGVDDFLAKPLRPAELGARLRAAERVLALEAGLAQRNQRLAAAYDQLANELEMARALQRGTLPQPADFGGLRFDWLFEASSFVGGDTFDCFALGPAHRCFYLVDVSGHGVAAAMMAFHAQHLLLGLSRQLAAGVLTGGGSAAEAAVAVVAEHNARLLQMRETSQYLTLIYGIVDTAAGELAFVQAGHPPPLFAPRGSGEAHEVGRGGLPVGIVPDAGYEAEVLPLAAGDRLYLYSDGVTECRDASGTEFGVERLRVLLAGERTAPLARSGTAVRAALRSWRGEGAFEDDISLLALEVG